MLLGLRLNKVALQTGQGRLGLCERQSQRRRRAAGRGAAPDTSTMTRHCTRPLPFPVTRPVLPRSASSPHISDGLQNLLAWHAPLFAAERAHGSRAAIGALGRVAVAAPGAPPTLWGLETGASDTYCPGMAEDSAPTPAPAAWLESLGRSKMQIAAGESVPLLPVLDRLRASAEQLEAEQGVTADGAKVTASH